MSWHVGAYFQAIDNTANTDVDAAVDDILPIQNTHLLMPRDVDLIGAIAMSATLSRARINSPSIRQIAPLFIRPINVSAAGVTNVNMMLMHHSPYRIRAYEEIAVEATSAVAMGSEDFTAALFLRDRHDPVPRGNIIPLRWTSTTAAVADTWTTISLTFADTIPSGLYTAVLSEHQSASARLHRWIFSNQEMRPGFPSVLTLASRLPYAISMGQWGAMGNFRSNDLPRLQVLCGTTDNAHEGHLFVVKVGELP